ncbi:hypothetical protein AAC387_Pa03g0910 [Persea americana]
MGEQKIFPFLALQDEVQGDPKGVHKAVELIASRLRKFLCANNLMSLLCRDIKGLPSFGRDASHPSTNTHLPAPVIKQVAQNMKIPLAYADAVIGTAGANISYIRRASGANITFQESQRHAWRNDR